LAQEVALEAKQKKGTNTLVTGDDVAHTVSFGLAGPNQTIVTNLTDHAGAAVTPDAATGSINMNCTIPSVQFSAGPLPSQITLEFTGAPFDIVRSLSGDTATKVYPDATGDIKILGGTAITVDDSVAGQLTINSTAPTGFVWAQVPGAAQALVAAHGYIANNAGMTVFTLPAAAAIGDTFAVTGMNNDFGWRVAQNAGQTIYFGEVVTTTGVTGYIQSTKTRDLVYIVCTNTNDSFEVVTSVGNIDYN
jgi:hypothetical protein